jgi:predicted transcriptional regulator
MATSILIHIDDATEARLNIIARELGRDTRDLAQTSVEEAALGYFRSRRDDPARVPSKYETI